MCLLIMPCCFVLEIQTVPCQSEVIHFLLEENHKYKIKTTSVNAGDVRMQDNQGRCPGGGHSNTFSILPWRIPTVGRPGGL